MIKDITISSRNTFFINMHLMLNAVTFKWSFNLDNLWNLKWIGIYGSSS
jgi:hypothetical protein